MKRKTVFKGAGVLPEKIVIDPKPMYDLSPYLNMQFMEPLGTADASVDSGWDFINNRWKPDLIEIIKEISPSMIRWGGCFASVYKWREGVGPYEKRAPMLNVPWGGIYSNMAGTREIIGMCREVGAEPLFTVNMESDGRLNWANPASGVNRSGSADEAADWVRYCNDPDDAGRISHGSREPYGVKYWQIGNETSYDRDGYGCEKAVETTLRFAKKMRAADPSVKLIAWGDDGWAGKMCEACGDLIDLIAVHPHYASALDGSPLYGNEYRKDFTKTWEHFMSAHKILDDKIAVMREQLAPYGKRLALTEGHFVLPGRNRCEALSSWAAGVAYARLRNVISRGGDIVDIATMADFFGNRWQVNAIITSGKKPYLQPVGRVMALFGKHAGEKAVKVSPCPGLDVTASRTGDTIFLHVANISMETDATVQFEISGMNIKSGTAREISEDPRIEITELTPELFAPVTKKINGNEWTFPAASVTAVELTAGLY